MSRVDLLGGLGVDPTAVLVQTTRGWILGGHPEIILDRRTHMHPGPPHPHDRADDGFHLGLHPVCGDRLDGKFQ